MRFFEKVLITGIAGSGGSYLAEYIVKNHPKVEVHGIRRWHTQEERDNLSAIFDKVIIHECDLVDFSSVLAVLRKVKPNAIFHLASYANVRTSFITPLAVLENNIMGTANLFEAIRASGTDPVIQLCSTSEVYGQVEANDVPIGEDCLLRPVSPYAISKACQDLLGFSYFKSWQMRIIRTRMFAYLNPRREDLFASSFAKQVAEIEIGIRKELVHGNLNSVRTLIDVRDAMESYWFALVKGRIGEVYNIGGNKVITVGDFLDILKKLARSKIKTKLDKNLLRPVDVTLQIPDVSKFQKATGWKPKYTFRESVSFLLEYWRERVKADYGKRN